MINQIMLLHPLSKCILALDIVVTILVLPPLYGALTAAFALGLLAIIPIRSEAKLARPFLKLFVVGAVFLFLIQAVTWRPPGISPDGIVAMLAAIARIGAVISAILFLSGQVTADELYAVLIDAHVPTPVILILFRTLWLVPRFMERMDEVLLAQRLRGMRLHSIRDRIRALLPSFTPVFASMLDETYTHSLTMTLRGFLEPGRKSHQLVVPFRWYDGIVMTSGIVVALLLIMGVG